MISKISRYYSADSMPNQILKESYTGNIELAGEEIDKNPNLVVATTCKCGFPLQVDFKKDGKLTFTPGEDIKVECLLCKHVHVITTYQKDIDS